MTNSIMYFIFGCDKLVSEPQVRSHKYKSSLVESYRSVWRHLLSIFERLQDFRRNPFLYFVLCVHRLMWLKDLFFTLLLMVRTRSSLDIKPVPLVHSWDKGHESGYTRASKLVRVGLRLSPSFQELLMMMG